MKRSFSAAVSPALSLAFVLGISACAGPHSAARTAVTASSSEVLPFIEDDYPRALAEARASKKPLFVDGWAPW